MKKYTMTKETKQWVKASKAWIKTQKVSIESCDQNIRQCQEQLRLLKKRIYLETLERAEKVKQLRQVELNIKKAK